MGVGELVVLAETLHVCCQGQNPDSLFSSICVWSEIQGQCMLNRTLRIRQQFSALSEFLTESGT